jgi:hypothetical protein
MDGMRSRQCDSRISLPGSFCPTEVKLTIPDRHLMIAIVRSRRPNAAAHSCHLALTGREPTRPLTRALRQLTPSTAAIATGSTALSGDRAGI